MKYGEKENNSKEWTVQVVSGYPIPEFLSALEGTKIKKDMEKKTCLIAVYDILGFKDWLVEGFEKKIKNYISAIELAMSDLSVKVNYQLFSDTIVVYTNDASPLDLESIVVFSSKLLYNLLIIKIPVRGCISYGELVLYNHEDIDIIIGKPLIDAFLFEQRQNWIGIMISPLVIEQNQIIFENLMPFGEMGYPSKDFQLNNTNNPWSFLIQKYCNIPLYNDKKETQVFDGYCIIPTKKNANTLQLIMDSIRETAAYLLNLKMLSFESDYQQKYQRTIDWYEFLLRECNRSKRKLGKQTFLKLGYINLKKK